MIGPLWALSLICVVWPGLEASPSSVVPLTEEELDSVVINTTPEPGMFVKHFMLLKYLDI